MRSNLTFPLIFFAAILASPVLARSQAQPSAIGGTAKPALFSIGAGASNFNVDWGHNRMIAITVWADWHPFQHSSILSGLGLELEGRDLNYGRPITLPSNFRQDSAGAGPIYTFTRLRNIRPYGKFLVGYASFDFRTNIPTYSHDTRSYTEPAGGFDVRAWRHLWARAEYDYQIW